MNQFGLVSLLENYFFFQSLSMNAEKPPRIAIADDHAITRKGISNLLNENGISVVIEVQNGLELIQSIEMSPSIPDICILEVGMPILDGYKTIDILNKRWPDIKNLVFTVLANKYNLIKMIGFGVSGFLPKNTSSHELVKAINEISDTGSYHSQMEMSYLSAIKNIADFKNEYFTEKELQFIRYCCSELTYKEIASRMNASLRTIDHYRDTLFERLNVKSRVGIAMYAVDYGIR